MVATLIGIFQREPLANSAQISARVALGLAMRLIGALWSLAV